MTRDQRQSAVLVAAGISLTAVTILDMSGIVDAAGGAQWIGAHAVPIVSLGLGIAFVAVGFSTLWLRARPPKQVRSTIALSRWTVATAGAIVVIVAWGATAWLLREASHATDVAATRVEAIKTGLSIGAGTGGVFALLLAFRRQWHQEIAGKVLEHDAIERRVTELYTKAVEQLGSDKAAVRIGGMYALERLAQDNPNHRQTVVNVLCGYLRMPYELVPIASVAKTTTVLPPWIASGIDSAPAEADSIGDPKPSDSAEELEVRLTAQGIITSHLRLPQQDRPEVRSSLFWPDIELDSMPLS